MMRNPFAIDLLPFTLVLRDNRAFLSALPELPRKDSNPKHLSAKEYRRREVRRRMARASRRINRHG